MTISTFARRVAVSMACLATALSGALVFSNAPARAASCADVEVIFARGTIEPAPPMGLTGLSFSEAVRSQLPGKTVSSYGVNYPASDQFNNRLAIANSVAVGVRSAQARIKYLAATCPDTKIVLGGYSQGAAVAGFTTATGIDVPNEYRQYRNQVPPPLPADVAVAELVPMVEPEASVEVLALSGRTSSEALALGPVLVSRVPTRVLVMLGTNDIRREGATTGIRMVSISETARNLRALRLLLETESGARVRFVVPPPVDPGRVAATRELTGEWWDPADVPGLVATVREVDPDAIDLSRMPIRPDFWEDDGLHPSPIGQVAILRAVLARI